MCDQIWPIGAAFGQMRYGQMEQRRRRLNEAAERERERVQNAKRSGRHSNNGQPTSDWLLALQSSSRKFSGN